MPLQPARKIQDSVRFGDDFELDGGAYQLRRSGRVLKLERIPMEILLYLIQQRGELVSRDQIIEKIWGNDIYLDTDNSINGAIRKIRHVLKDHPEQPRFIQTVTGRGYRFIAPVTEIYGAIHADIPSETESVIAVPQTSVAGDHALTSPRRRWRVSRATWVLGAMLVLAAFLGGYYRWTGARTKGRQLNARTMLAILPFGNLTGDVNQEYFSDGMTEEMITRMGSLNSDQLGVIARTSVMHYKNSRESLPQIARELGVQYILEGSVRRDANMVRITAQLIQTKDQTHVWARQYDREINDVLVIQSEIAQEISDEILIALGSHKTVASAVQPRLSPQAYEGYNLYLKGQFFLNKRSVPALQEAIRNFEQATSKDPKNASAYAGLADACALIGGYSGAPASEFSSQARAAALQALQIDDRLPEAHTALALIVQNYDYDWQTSEKEFKRAIELNPNYATAHQWYAEHLAWRGRFDEALRESERARQLDPLSLIIAADNGAILYYSRQYDRAIAQFEAVREMDPDFSRASMISAAYVQKGLFNDALADVDKHYSGDTPWRWANLAYDYGRAGRQTDAQHALKRLLDLNQRRPVDPITIVLAYIGVGNNEEALVWLGKAYAQRSNGLTALGVDAHYDPLRGAPQFQEILRRVGLTL